MTKPYRSVPADEVLGGFPAERKARIAARTAELIGEELALTELRKSRRMTQQALAEKLGGRQVYVSRLEKRGDLKLSTLRDYVRALGGELQLVVSFPEGDVTIKPAGEAMPLAARQSAKQPAARRKASA